MLLAVQRVSPAVLQAHWPQEQLHEVGVCSPGERRSAALHGPAEHGKTQLALASANAAQWLPLGSSQCFIICVIAAIMPSAM